VNVTEFSESSYAFAVARDLVGGALGTIVGAPEFPTLRQEGAGGGGYDIRIPLQAVAVFFQFKVPQVLRRSSRGRPPNFPIPYYRIPLRTKRPNQHQLLLDLESQHKLVFYAAPLFHQSNDLNQYYVQSAVANHSAFFLPSDIGQLDERDHHIAYCQTSSVGWYCSEPTKIKRSISAKAASKTIQHAVANAPKRSPEQFIEQLAEVVVKIVNKQAPEQTSEGFGLLQQVYEEPASGKRIAQIPDKPFEPITGIVGGISQIAEIVRAHLSCELLVFGKLSETVS
jgi:hypothetical protein